MSTRSIITVQRTQLRIPSVTGRVVRYPIDDNVPDAVSIVRLLNELAVENGRDPDVRAWVEELLPRSIQNNDTRAQIRAATNFVRAALIYTMDPEGTEYVTTPLVLFERISMDGYAREDCDGHALFLAAILGSIGFTARVIGVKMPPAGEYFDHVIDQVQTDHGWQDIDPTQKETATPPVYEERLVV